MSTQNDNRLLPQRRDLVYYGRMEKQKNYLMKVDKQFLADLQTSQEMIVEGQSNDHVIVNSICNSYRVKGVNISTTMLVINEAGTIFYQSSSYLQVQKFDPLFNQIYRNLNRLSCRLPDKEGVQTFNDLIDNHSFTDYSIKKQCFLNEQNFDKLCRAMNLVKINSDMEEEGTGKYLFIGLPLAVWIMRQIFKVFNQLGKSSFQSIPAQAVLQMVPVINMDILKWIIRTYQFNTENNQGSAHPLWLKMTQKSIARYIISEMALAKKQYTAYTFNEVLEEMLLIYMPAEAQISSASLKEKQKQKQQLFACRLEYFIQLKGEKYVFYDHLEIDPDVTIRLNFLSGFKKKWRTAELKAIFRGFDTAENGRSMTLSDVLLKKFRKYGDQYEIKFTLPSK